MPQSLTGSYGCDADTHVALQSCHKGTASRKPGTSRAFSMSCMLECPHMRILWLLMALVLSTMLALFHSFALATYLYWQYVWLDVPVHLLGGLTLGMVFIGIETRFRPIAFVLFMAAVIIGWEVFEYMIGTPREANFIFDTSLDVLMGALGGTLAYLLARFTLWRSA